MEIIQLDGYTELEKIQIAKRHLIPRQLTGHGLRDSDVTYMTDVYLHVPAGAIPKDGPSAGIAMVLAQASLYSNRIVRSKIGMTGEVTLRGRVLPVGGIKMKILAAHRAGLDSVILPQRNSKDLEDVPSEVRDSMNFILVDHIDEAIEAALLPVQDKHPVHKKRIIKMTLAHEGHCMTAPLPHGSG